jgi:hypothetical protein
MYFVQEDGKTFKATHILMPYFLVQIKVTELDHLRLRTLVIAWSGRAA